MNGEGVFPPVTCANPKCQQLTFFPKNGYCVYCSFDDLLVRTKALIGGMK